MPQRSSVLAPLLRFCDKGTAPQSSTQTKPDSVHPMPSNDNATDTRDSPEIISMLREPAAAEKVLLGLLALMIPRLCRSMMTACLHFAMWLREHGESSLASRERDEARARVAELEEKVRNVEEIMKHQVQEYKSKLNGLQNDVDQQRQKAAFCERKWKQQLALHQEKSTRLEEVLRQLVEANSNLAKDTQSLDVARTHIEKLTGALTRTRKLYKQAEVEVKKVQQDCEMDRILGEIEKEERVKKRIALTTELELVEDFQNQNQKEGGIMPTLELNKDVSKQVNEAKNVDGEVEAQHPSTFWTRCHCCNGSCKSASPLPGMFSGLCSHRRRRTSLPRFCDIRTALTSGHAKPKSVHRMRSNGSNDVNQPERNATAIGASAKVFADAVLALPAFANVGSASGHSRIPRRRFEIDGSSLGAYISQSNQVIPLQNQVKYQESYTLQLDKKIENLQTMVSKLKEENTQQTGELDTAKVELEKQQADLEMLEFDKLLMQMVEKLCGNVELIHQIDLVMGEPNQMQLREILQKVEKLCEDLRSVASAGVVEDSAAPAD
ncbi:hypothetical protein Prudu_022680 [Prunus dulcis]|uniref:Uncharacterized protein n=1 Tax=Prunus dulcis TaxID=3755 RepID=A0A4Y1S095_PRUDU|nr:hypothetical protein Prudu_022680 [Prunus dulcis]